MAFVSDTKRRCKDLGIECIQWRIGEGGREWAKVCLPATGLQLGLDRMVLDDMRTRPRPVLVIGCERN